MPYSIFDLPLERWWSRGNLSMQVVACEPVQNLKWRGPRLELVVACGSLKGGRSDWLVEKATEMHAYAFTPLLTTNSSNIGSARNNKRQAGEDSPQDSGRLQRWQRVTAAAMKQCLRVHAMKLPTREHVWNVHEAAAAISNGAVALVATQGGNNILQELANIQQVHTFPLAPYCVSVSLFG